jgi:hypothetical protein
VARPAPAGRAPSGSGTATPGDLVRVERRRLTDRWPREGNPDSEFGARVRAEARRTRIRSALLAARRPEEILDAVLDHGSVVPPTAAALAAVDVNGTVTMLATHGVPGPAAARWQRFPLDLELPVCDVIRDGAVRWLDAEGSAGARTGPNGTDRADPSGPDPSGPDPSGTDRGLGLGLPGGWGSAALLPLASRGETLGILVLTWADAPPPGVRREFERLAAGVAGAVHRVLRSDPAATPPAEPVEPAEPGTADPTLAVLDTLLHPVLVCRPIRDEQGGIGDLRVLHANPVTRDPAGRGPGQLAGRRLLDLYPDAATDGLWDACTHVLRTGDPADLPAHRWRLAVQGRTFDAETHLRVTRYRDGVLLTWVSAQRPRDLRGRS